MRTINSLPYLHSQKFSSLFSGFISILSTQNSKKPKYPFFSFSGSKLVDSSLIFKDGQFEDVSEIRKANGWKYVLLDKVNCKAKCSVKISDGEYCDRILSVTGGNTTIINNHLKRLHGIIC